MVSFPVLQLMRAMTQGFGLGLPAADAWPNVAGGAGFDVDLGLGLPAPVIAQAADLGTGQG